MESGSPRADATRSMRCTSKESADGRSQTSISKGEMDLETDELSRELDVRIGCANFPPEHLSTTLPENSINTLSVPSSKSLVKIPNTTKFRVEPFDTGCQLSGD